MPARSFTLLMPAIKYVQYSHVHRNFDFLSDPIVKGLEECVSNIRSKTKILLASKWTTRKIAWQITLKI